MSLKSSCHAAGRRRRVRFAKIMGGALAASSILTATHVLATSAHWDSSPNTAFSPLDGSGTWNLTSTNWYNGSTDVSWQTISGGVAVFGDGQGAAGTVQVASNVSVGGITFATPGTGGSYTISSAPGDSILLTGGPTSVFTTNSGQSPTISATLAGGSGLTTQGSGTLNLTGANTYAGGTSVAAGTLNIAGPTALGSGQLSVSSGATLVINAVTGLSGGSVEMNGTFNVATGQLFTTGSNDFEQDAGTVNVKGSLLAQDYYFDAGNITGQVTLNVASSTLYLSQGLTSNTGSFLLTGSAPTVEDTIPNNVTVTLQPLLGQSTLSLDDSGTNNGTLSLISANNSYVLFYANSQFTNNGTFTVSASGTQSATFDAIFSPMINNGAATLNANISSNAAVTNNGLFIVGAGQTYLVNGSYTFNQTGGTLSVNGKMGVTNFNFYGGTISGQVLFNGASGLLYLGPGIGTGTGNFLFTGQTTSDLYTSSGIPANVSITVAPNSSSGLLYYSTGGALTNSGTVSLISASNSSVNFSGGTLFTNNGTLNISSIGPQSISGNLIAFNMSNAGTVSINANTSTNSNVTNTGTFNIAANQYFSVGNGAFNQTAGTLNINGQMSAANFNFSGGNITGIVQLAASTPSLTLGPGGGSGTGNFVFISPSTSDLFASAGVPASVSITLAPTSSFGSLYYASSGGLTNNGTISLISASNSFVGLSAGALFTNNGTFSISASGAQSTSVDSITSNMINNGTVNINANTSTYSNVTNNGIFSIAANQYFSSTYAFNQAGGALNINGQFSVSSFNFSGGNINGQVLFNGSSGSLVIGPSVGSGTGNFLFTGTNSYLTTAVGIPTNVSITLHPNSSSNTLYLQGGGGLTNSGILSLISAPGSYIALNAGTVFTNNGTFSISPGGVQSATFDAINSNVINNAVFNLNANTSTGSNVTNNGTFTIAAGQTFTFGSSSAFNQAGGTLNINGQLSVSNFNFSGGNINGLVLFNTSTGNLTLGSGVGSGTGNFLFTGPTSSYLNTAVGIPTNVSITLHPNSSSNTLYLQGGGGLTNSGILSLISAPGSYIALNAGTVFTNNGTFSISPGGVQSATFDGINSNVINNAVFNLNANTSTGSNVTNNGTFTIAAGQTFTVGSSNAFNQAGGTLNINGQLSVSNFNFSGGNINGLVLFNTSTGNLTLGSGVGSGTGNFLFTGPTSSYLNTAVGIPANINITVHPNSSSGTFYYQGTGGLTNSGTLSLISAPGSFISLSAGTVFTNNGAFSISTAGVPSSTFYSINSSTTNNGTFNDNANVSSGGVIINNGTFNVAVGQSLTFGSNGLGFGQNSGTLNAAGNYYVGGTSAGATNTGFLNISGGSVVVANTLKVWNSASAVPLFLAGGSITTGTLDTSGVPGNFHWISGLLDIDGSNPVIEASAASPFGSSLAIGGGMTFIVAAGDSELLGLNYAGTINQSGGTHQITGALDLGVNIASSGTYNLTGSGNLAVAGTENIGLGSQGTFSQTGGTHATSSIVIGTQSTANGQYFLSGGTLTASVGVYVGQSGMGLLSQTNGSQYISELGLGTAFGGAGTAIFTGGSAMITNAGVGGTASVAGGSGSFTISGSASVTITGGLTVFDSPLNTLVVASGGALSAANVTLLGGLTTVTNGSTMTIGTGGLTFGGNDSPAVNTASGTLFLNGDVSFTGTGGTANIYSSGTGKVDLGGTLRNFNVAQSSATVSMAIGSNITDGSLNKTGSGTLLLYGADTFTGSATVSAGTLQLGNALALNQASGTFVLPGATLDLNGQSIGNDPLSLNGTGLAGAGALINSSGTAAGFAGTITLVNNVAVGGYGPITISGAINGPGGLSKIGFNTVTLSGGGNFSGGVNVTSGTLAITAPISFTGGINLSGGTLAVAADADLGNAANSITLSANGTLEALGTFSTSRTVTALGGTLSVDAGQTLTLNGNVGGAGPLTKAGAGTLSLTSPCNITGLITISAGTFSLAGPGGALPSVTGVDVTTTGILELNSTTGNQAFVPQNRVNDLAPIILAGGTLSMQGSSTASTTETLGQLILQPGASTIAVNAGAGQSASITFSSLGARSPGGTLAYVANDPGNTDQVFFSSGVADGTHLGGWATVNGTDFAKYSVSHGVIPFAPSDYTVNNFVGGADVYLNSSWSGTVPAISIATLNLNSSTGLTVTQNPGTVLTLSAGGLLKQGAGTASVSGGTLNSSSGELDIYVGGAGALSISAALVGSFVLTERGSGTLVLNGNSNNNYTGFTLVSGNLQLDAAGTAIHGALIVDGGSVVSEASYQLDPASAVTLNSGSWDLQGHTENIAQFTNNNGTMLFHGGTLNLSNGAVLTGGITTVASTVISPTIQINGGDNQLEADGLMEATSLFQFNYSSPALQVSSDASTPGKVLLTLGANLTFTGTGTASMASVGNAALPGILDLSGTSSHSFIVVSGSILAISTSITDGGFEFHGGGTLALTGVNTYAGGTTISGTGSELTAYNTSLGAPGSTVTFNGGILGLRNDSPSATFPYSGTVATSGTSTNIDIDRATPLAGDTTGTFTINTLTLGSGNAAFTLTGNDGGTLVVGGTAGSGATILYNTAAPGTAYFETTANLTIFGPLVSSGGGAVDIYKDQSGTMTLSGAGSNVFGNVTVAAGTLLLSKTGGAIAIPGSGFLNISGGVVRLTQSNQISSAISITINGGAGASLLDLNGNNNTFGSAAGGGITFLAGGTLSTGTGTAMLAGNVVASSNASSTATALIEGNLNLGTSTPTFTIARGSGPVDLQISAAISGGSSQSPVGITKAGPGTLYLTGANTFTGPIQVQAGVLEVNSAANLGNTANFVTLDGGTLQFYNSFDPSAGGGLNLPVSSSLDTLGNTVPIAGSITGGGSLNKLGVGTLFLKGTNTFNGLTISAGTVEVPADSALGATGTPITFVGGTLNPTGALTTARQFLITSGGAIVNASAGTLTLTTAPSWAGNLNVSAGTLAFNIATGSPTVTATESLIIMPNATVIDGGTVDPLHAPGITALINVLGSAGSAFDVTTASKTTGNISGAGSTNISTGATLAATSIQQTNLFAYGNVNISPQTGAHNASSTVSVVTSLALSGVASAWTSRVDLANNDMIVHSGTLTTIVNQFQQAYGSGTWNGSYGLYSSSAAADPTHLTVLGIIQNNESGSAIYGNGTTLPLFDGQVAGASDVLIKYTYYGDADLNGKVDGSDYSRIDYGYLHGSTGWINGDFNYDGVVNGSDYALIDNAYNSQGAQLSAEIAGPQAIETAVLATTSSSVPEPTATALLAIAAVGLLGRRSRNK